MRKSQHKEMERKITLALIIGVVLFIAFLIASSNGTTWLKVIYALIDIGIAGYCLWLLYQNGELMRRRSFWMTVASGALILCIIASIILNYPSPNLYG